MKYICLSFDDARRDTYTRALPILEKNGLVATLNVITDFIGNAGEIEFESSKEGMKKEELLKWLEKGNEVACHGRKHQNTVQDILDNIEDLKKIGIDTKNIGFASPSSNLTLELAKKEGILELYRGKTLSYLRTGIKVRREGLIYTTLCFLDKFLHSNNLFYYLNKRVIFNKNKLPLILSAVPIKSYTKVEQIKYLIEKLRDEECIILMFHSILLPKDEGYFKDHWVWNEENFNELCEFLSKNREIKVLTTKKLIMD